MISDNCLVQLDFEPRQAWIYSPRTSDTERALTRGCSCREFKQTVLQAARIPVGESRVI